MNIANALGRIAFGAAIIGLSVSPLMAQDTPSPAATDTPPAASTVNGPSSGAEDQIKDSDVFGFDITMGTANLTAEQRAAATNTCKEKVMADATHYSSAARTFCEQLQ